MTTCTVLPVAASLHGPGAVAELMTSLTPILDIARAEVVDSVDAADTAIPLGILLLTGGTEHEALAAWRARQQLVPGEPLLLLTHPGHNSLPAALETLARIQGDGARGRIVVVHPDTPRSDELAAAVHDVRVWHRMHASRVGLLGKPSDWLVASVPDRAAVARRWGPTIVDADLSVALDRFADNIDAPLAEPVRVRARHHQAEPHPADIETAARFEPVLREVAAEHHLDAVTVRCFDLVTSAYTSGCLALSALNDRGVVAGCEGDVAATMALLWFRQLFGRIGWMANPALADRQTGIIELAHCTVPLDLVDSYELHTHFESGLGVGIAGHLPAGPVTLVRLGGNELEKMWCVDGTALPTTPRAGRCRTQLDVKVDPAAVGELLDHPLGNHLVVVPGHHAAEAWAWWRAMIGG